MFVARSHIGDIMPPFWNATGDCAEFIRRHLKIDPWDLARLFDQWGCNQNKSELYLSVPYQSHLCFVQMLLSAKH